MKKTLFYIISVFFLVNCVNASQDAFLYVDSKNTALCFAYDDYTNPVCNGSSVQVEGTKDGMLYILPQAEITQNDNMTTQFTYIINKPLNWLVGVSMIIGFFVMLMAVIYGVSMLLSAFSR